MAKAIVKINAFLDKKQTDEVYNSIYNQLKAGLDIIIVPAYCDVYVLDGADVEMQKEAKDTTPEWLKIVRLAKQKCETCRYTYMSDCIPCTECCYNCYNAVNLYGYDKWEAKKDE